MTEMNLVHRLDREVIYCCRHGIITFKVGKRILIIHNPAFGFQKKTSAIVIYKYIVAAIYHSNGLTTETFRHNTCKRRSLAIFAYRLSHKRIET